MWDSFFAWFLQSGQDTFQNFYAEELRGNLFSGCLTFSGFLYAAYTFIIVHMKTHVFDIPEYKDRFREQQKANEKLTHYGPLKRLSRALMLAVILTLGAGLVQLTFGLIEYNWAALLCVSLAIVAAVFLIRGVCLMAQNMRMWFDLIDGTAPPSPSANGG